MKRWLIPLFFLFVSATSKQVHTLYTSLDPHSIPQHLAFHQLYPNSPEGIQALEHAWKLLTGNPHVPSDAKLLTQLSPTVDTLITLISKDPQKETITLSDSELALIEKASSHLSNRWLKGHTVTSEEEVLALPSNEIDLARGLFLSELGPSLKRIRSYEAMIDLMSLQILARLPQHATPKQKIDAINTFIFEEMGFRFPPHSLYSKDIDLYTFLPAVLDSRRGVCLGVSILYICIAQRLNLPLEIITPPGHIFIRHDNINIETTARGINLDDEEYLSIDTRSLQLRTLKEVIGMAHFNNASRFWHHEQFDKVRESYMKALPYMPQDMFLKELIGYTEAILGNKAEATKILKQVEHHLPDYAVSGENMAEDFLKGNVDAEGLKAIFMYVDETRESIQKKQQKLKQVLAEHPKFRSGIFALATTWLQLHRLGEALAILKQFHELDPSDPTVEYYLAILYAMRMDYNNAWKHTHNVEKLTAARNHHPKALKELVQSLNQLSPAAADDAN